MFALVAFSREITQGENLQVGEAVRTKGPLSEREVVSLAIGLSDILHVKASMMLGVQDLVSKLGPVILTLTAVVCHPLCVKKCFFSPISMTTGRYVHGEPKPAPCPRIPDV